ncbi:MAG: hypothetical protein OEZ65_06290 [Gemmatimonadota bacterium]|nr:hypothetical protein [Gemmatimonadota bacterium]MDH5759179.1 hypothetical protein [Gemmatimonadota bacterium]
MSAKRIERWALLCMLLTATPTAAQDVRVGGRGTVRVGPIRAEIRVFDRDVASPEPMASARYVHVSYERFRFRKLGRLEERRYLDGHDLRDLLRKRRYGQLRDHAEEVGARGRLRGVWIYPYSGGRVLAVTADGLPIAEFVDQDGDGRVDVTFWMWP